MKKSNIYLLFMGLATVALTGCSQQSQQVLGEISQAASLVPIHGHVSKSKAKSTGHEVCTQTSDGHGGYSKSCHWDNKSSSRGISVGG